MQPKPPTDGAVEALRERLARQPWQVIRTAPAAGAWNMAVDWALLEAAAAGDLLPSLRFYTWDPPAVSLGRFQRLTGIDTHALHHRGWDLVRRPTGGRAVLHHLELTYSIILPPTVVASAGVRTSYAALVRPLNDALRSLLPPGAPPEGGLPCEGAGVREPNCFALASECDTVLGGGKLVGSAQVRHRGALLQHGSILLDADRTAWTELFGGPGRLTTIHALLGRRPDAAEVEAALLQSFEAHGVRFRETRLPPLPLRPDGFELNTGAP